MARLHLVLALAYTVSGGLIKRFTISDSPQGTVDQGVITDCTYWIDAESGDSCGAIEDYFGLTQNQLISYNPALKTDCSGLTVGHSYCVEENYGQGPIPTTAIPTTTTTTTLSSTTAVVTTSKATTSTSKATTTTSKTASPTGSVPSPTQSGLTPDCKTFYFVAPGDSCSAIVQKYATFTLDQFYSWNPAIDTSCSNLQSGYYVCVGTANTPTAPPTSTPRPSTTTAAPTTSKATTSSTPSAPTPRQPGIISTCNKYAKSAAGDSCATFASTQGLSLGQLYAWNSILGAHGETCNQFLGNEYYCTGVSGPLPAPGPVQDGVVSTCVKYAQAATGSTCSAFAASNSIAATDLYTWNPVLGANGANCATSFWANEYYCVAVAGAPAVAPNTPQQPGIISTCNKYVKSNPGGSCSAFSSRNGISAAQLYAWNSVLGYHGENCASAFLANEYYCTGVSGPLPAPGSVQAGVVDTCTNYAMANPGGSCTAFSSRTGITPAQLYAWNTVLGPNGENCSTQFWANTYYCIAVAG